MTFPSRMPASALAVFLSLAALSGTAKASVLYEFDVAGSDQDGALKALAIFTINNGNISIQLTNLQANPTAAGQLISGIKFTLSNAPGAVTGAGTSGQLISVNTSNGTYTNVAGNPSRWEAAGHITQSGSSGELLVLGGSQPDEMIIGPPDSHNRYSNANSSINNFNPQVFESAYFALNAPNVTTSTVVTTASIIFGTGPEATLRGTPVAPIPEPSTMALAIAGLTAAGLGRFLKRRRSA
jgi:hypothetical protein